MMRTNLKIFVIIMLLISTNSCLKHDIENENFIGKWTWSKNWCKMTINIIDKNTGELYNSNSSSECFNKYIDTTGRIYIKNNSLHIGGYIFHIIKNPAKTGKIVDSLTEWKMTLRTTLLWASQTIDFYKYSSK